MIFGGSIRPEHEAHHSPPTTADVKNAWNYTFTPPYIQTNSVAHLDPCPVSTVDSSSGGKKPGE
jgi:hypothetical protein